MLYGSEVAIHARIQEFSSGGGVQVSLTKKALTFFCFFSSSAYFTKVKWSILKKSFIFQGSRGGPTYSKGVQLFPEGVQLLIPDRNPYNLWFSRGGGGVRTPSPPLWIRTCNQNEFINASSNGSDEPAQKHGLARAFSVRTHSFHARMKQT